jgi:hypothetical protein
MTIHPRVTDVTAQSGFHVRLTFADGSSGSLDLSPWIVGHHGVFAALQDPAFFAQVAVDRNAGTIVWPNGADLDPDVLYEAVQSIEATSWETPGEM